jgi:hypothetical protein
MIRRALLLLTIAGIYIALTRNRQKAKHPATDQVAEANWANEGGANAPASV